ncbi:MAG TPA: L-ribulose-5-phosphate 4-epimerase AraD, partial [Acidimicrobiales bacterium]|nr:L-ribulose-5-phosphate 4-epimerase AraD [Acidimicrobiales bacterium]
ELKSAVLEANLALPAAGLVTLTWGNVSGRDSASGLVVIKPSGVPYGTMTVDDMVVVDPSGAVVEGGRRPSTDTPTHLVLYDGLAGIGAVVHTHSTWATVWAQAHRAIPLLGTTHADLCPGEIPVTDAMTAEQVAADYEANTGKVILATVASRGAQEAPAVLVAGHGPFCWSSSPAKAVEMAVTVEAVAKMAWLTVALEPDVTSLPSHLVERHFYRKHGPGSYYGQP